MLKTIKSDKIIWYYILNGSTYDSNTLRNILYPYNFLYDSTLKTTFIYIRLKHTFVLYL